MDELRNGDTRRNSFSVRMRLNNTSRRLQFFHFSRKGAQPNEGMHARSIANVVHRQVCPCGGHANGKDHQHEEMLASRAESSGKGPTRERKGRAIDVKCPGKNNEVQVP